MRKIIILLTLSLCMSFPIVVQDITSQYECLHFQYPKLTQEWFRLIQDECYKYNINPADVCAIIEYEGQWNANSVNTKNKDGSIDYGLMQINSKHVASHAERFLNPKLNIQKGVYEYYLCLRQSHYDKKEANRLYNAGRASHKVDYKNWNYVKRIDAERAKTQQIESEFYSLR